MTVTETFKTQVREAWGNPRRIAEAALNEMFRHGDEIGLDHDDQVRHAVNIGILSGELKDSNPETFIERFVVEILNEG